MSHFLVIWICILACLPVPLRAEDARNVTITTGGMLRLPNAQQPSEKQNGAFEGWIKTSWSVAQSPLSVFLRAKTVADSAGYTYNNHTTLGFGAAFKVKPGRRAAVTVSLRHDWQRRRSADRRGTRLILDYFFFDYHVPKPSRRMFGMDQRALISKVYANLTAPETLANGDRNVALSGGAEVSAQLTIPDSRFQLSPYLAVHMGWDSAGNPWNNKLQPSIGVKLQWPLQQGDVHLGLRYQGDFRWVSESFHHGLGVFAGWYRTF